MNQDFIDWLNNGSTDIGNNKNENNNGTGLLLAPIVGVKTQEPEREPDSQSQAEGEIMQEAPDPGTQNDTSSLINELTELKSEVNEIRNVTPEEAAATGFVLNLNEPPPEMWARGVSNLESAEDYSNDPEDAELYAHYEQGIDFQEYNDKTPHGTNFTRRLQRILHERRERAEEERLREEKQKNHHPFLTKAILMCVPLIIALLFAWGVLIGLRKKIPDYAGQHSVQVTASSEDADSEPDPEPEQESEQAAMKTTSQPEQFTFEDFLRDGNDAFNLGVYNSALRNFFRAMELDDNDTRPYIGLAESYRAKKLFFDSRRILDEAFMIFRKHPTLETALKLLEGETRHEQCKRNSSK